MKLRTTSLAALAAFTIAGPASAAGVWSTIDWTGDSSLSFITSTNVTHSGDFGSAAEVNGHTFETIAVGATITAPYSGSNFTIATTGTVANLSTVPNATDFAGTVSGTESAKLSTGFGYLDYNLNGSANGSTVSYTLTGLTADTDYVFSFFSAAWSTANRTGTLDGSDDGVGNTQVIDQSSGTGGKIYQYAYNTGASTSFTMTITNTSTEDNNGIHHFAFANIPEPSAALLGGLGMLALLRRRRA